MNYEYTPYVVTRHRGGEQYKVYTCEIKAARPVFNLNNTSKTDRLRWNVVRGTREDAPTISELMRDIQRALDENDPNRGISYDLRHGLQIIAFLQAEESAQGGVK